MLARCLRSRASSCAWAASEHRRGPAAGARKGLGTALVGGRTQPSPLLQMHAADAAACLLPSSPAHRQPFPPVPLRLPPAPRVTQVLDGQLEVETKDGSRELIPFATCVWAAGIAMHPLVRRELGSWGWCEGAALARGPSPRCCRAGAHTPACRPGPTAAPTLLPLRPTTHTPSHCPLSCRWRA